MPPHNVSRLHELCTILSTDDPSQNYSDILRQGNRTVKELDTILEIPENRRKVDVSYAQQTTSTVTWDIIIISLCRFSERVCQPKPSIAASSAATNNNNASSSTGRNSSAHTKAAETTRKAILTELDAVLLYAHENGPRLIQSPRYLFQFFLSYLQNHEFRLLHGKQILQLFNRYIIPYPVYTLRLAGRPEDGCVSFIKNSDRNTLDYLADEMTSFMLKCALIDDHLSWAERTAAQMSSQSVPLQQAARLAPAPKEYLQILHEWINSCPTMVNPVEETNFTTENHHGSGPPGSKPLVSLSYIGHCINKWLCLGNSDTSRRYIDPSEIALNTIQLWCNAENEATTAWYFQTQDIDTVNERKITVRLPFVAGLLTSVNDEMINPVYNTNGSNSNNNGSSAREPMLSSSGKGLVPSRTIFDTFIELINLLSILCIQRGRTAHIAIVQTISPLLGYLSTGRVWNDLMSDKRARVATVRLWLLVLRLTASSYAYHRGEDSSRPTFRDIVRTDTNDTNDKINSSLGNGIFTTKAAVHHQHGFLDHSCDKHSEYMLQMRSSALNGTDKEQSIPINYPSTLPDFQPPYIPPTIGGHPSFRGFANALPLTLVPFNAPAPTTIAAALLGTHYLSHRADKFMAETVIQTVPVATANTYPNNDNTKPNKYSTLSSSSSTATVKPPPKEQRKTTRSSKRITQNDLIAEEDDDTNIDMHNDEVEMDKDIAIGGVVLSPEKEFFRLSTLPIPNGISIRPTVAPQLHNALSHNGSTSDVIYPYLLRLASHMLNPTAITLGTQNVAWNTATESYGHILDPELVPTTYSYFTLAAECIYHNHAVAIVTTLARGGLVLPSTPSTITESIQYGYTGYPEELSYNSPVLVWPRLLNSLCLPYASTAISSTSSANPTVSSLSSSNPLSTTGNLFTSGNLLPSLVSSSVSLTTQLELMCNVLMSHPDILIRGAPTFAILLSLNNELELCRRKQDNHLISVLKLLLTIIDCVTQDDNNPSTPVYLYPSSDNIQKLHPYARILRQNNCGFSTEPSTNIYSNDFGCSLASPFATLGLHSYSMQQSAQTTLTMVDPHVENSMVTQQGISNVLDTKLVHALVTQSIEGAVRTELHAWNTLVRTLVRVFIPQIIARREGKLAQLAQRVLTRILSMGRKKGLGRNVIVSSSTNVSIDPLDNIVSFSSSANGHGSTGTDSTLTFQISDINPLPHSLLVLPLVRIPVPQITLSFRFATQILSLPSFTDVRSSHRVIDISTAVGSSSIDVGTLGSSAGSSSAGNITNIHSLCTSASELAYAPCSAEYELLSLVLYITDTMNISDTSIDNDTLQGVPLTNPALTTVGKMSKERYFTTNTNSSTVLTSADGYDDLVYSTTLLLRTLIPSDSSESFSSTADKYRQLSYPLPETSVLLRSLQTFIHHPPSQVPRLLLWLLLRINADWSGSNVTRTRTETMEITLPSLSNALVTLLSRLHNQKVQRTLTVVPPEQNIGLQTFSVVSRSGTSIMNDYAAVYTGTVGNSLGYSFPGARTIAWSSTIFHGEGWLPTSTLRDRSRPSNSTMPHNLMYTGGSSMRMWPAIAYPTMLPPLSCLHILNRSYASPVLDDPSVSIDTRYTFPLQYRFTTLPDETHEVGTRKLALAAGKAILPSPLLLVAHNLLIASLARSACTIMGVQTIMGVGDIIALRSAYCPQTTISIPGLLSKGTYNPSHAPAYSVTDIPSLAAMGYIVRYSHCASPLHYQRAIQLLRLLVSITQSIEPLPTTIVSLRALASGILSYLALFMGPVLLFGLANRPMEGPPNMEDLPHSIDNFGTVLPIPSRLPGYDQPYNHLLLGTQNINFNDSSNTLSSSSIAAPPSDSNPMVRSMHIVRSFNHLLTEIVASSPTKPVTTVFGGMIGSAVTSTLRYINNESMDTVPVPLFTTLGAACIAHIQAIYVDVLQGPILGKVGEAFDIGPTGEKAKREALAPVMESIDASNSFADAVCVSSQVFFNATGESNAPLNTGILSTTTVSSMVSSATTNAPVTGMTGGKHARTQPNDRFATDAAKRTNNAHSGPTDSYPQSFHDNDDIAGTNANTNIGTEVYSVPPSNEDLDYKFAITRSNTARQPSVFTSRSRSRSVMRPVGPTGVYTQENRANRPETVDDFDDEFEVNAARRRVSSGATGALATTDNALTVDELDDTEDATNPLRISNTSQRNNSNDTNMGYSNVSAVAEVVETMQVDTVALLVADGIASTNYLASSLRINTLPEPLMSHTLSVCPWKDTDKYNLINTKCSGERILADVLRRYCLLSTAALVPSAFTAAIAGVACLQMSMQCSADPLSIEEYNLFTVQSLSAVSNRLAATEMFSGGTNDYIMTIISPSSIGWGTIAGRLSLHTVDHILRISGGADYLLRKCNFNIPAQDPRIPPLVYTEFPHIKYARWMDRSGNNGLPLTQSIQIGGLYVPYGAIYECTAQEMLTLPVPGTTGGEDDEGNRLYLSSNPTQGTLLHLSEESSANSLPTIPNRNIPSVSISSILFSLIHHLQPHAGHVEPEYLLTDVVHYAGNLLTYLPSETTEKAHETVYNYFGRLYELMYYRKSVKPNEIETTQLHRSIYPWHPFYPSNDLFLHILVRIGSNCGFYPFVRDTASAPSIATYLRLYANTGTYTRTYVSRSVDGDSSWRCPEVTFPGLPLPPVHTELLMDQMSLTAWGSVVKFRDTRYQRTFSGTVNNPETEELKRVSYPFMIVQALEDNIVRTDGTTVDRYVSSLWQLGELIISCPPEANTALFHLLLRMYPSYPYSFLCQRILRYVAVRLGYSDKVVQQPNGSTLPPNTYPNVSTIEYVNTSSAVAQFLHSRLAFLCDIWIRYRFSWEYFPSLLMGYPSTKAFLQIHRYRIMSIGIVYSAVRRIGWIMEHTVDDTNSNGSSNHRTGTVEKIKLNDELARKDVQVLREVLKQVSTTLSNSTSTVLHGWENHTVDTVTGSNTLKPIVWNDEPVNDTLKQIMNEVIDLSRKRKTAYWSTLNSNERRELPLPENAGWTAVFEEHFPIYQELIDTSKVPLSNLSNVNTTSSSSSRRNKATSNANDLSINYTWSDSIDGPIAELIHFIRSIREDDTVIKTNNTTNLRSSSSSYSRYSSSDDTVSTITEGTMRTGCEPLATVDPWSYNSTYTESYGTASALTTTRNATAIEIYEIGTLLIDILPTLMAYIAPFASSSYVPSTSSLPVVMINDEDMEGDESIIPPACIGPFIAIASLLHTAEVLSLTGFLKSTGSGSTQVLTTILASSSSATNKKGSSYDKIMQLIKRIGRSSASMYSTLFQTMYSIGWQNTFYESIWPDLSFEGYFFDMEQPVNKHHKPFLFLTQIFEYGNSSSSAITIPVTNKYVDAKTIEIFLSLRPHVVFVSLHGLMESIIGQIHNHVRNTNFTESLAGLQPLRDQIQYFVHQFSLVTLFILGGKGKGTVEDHRSSYGKENGLGMTTNPIHVNPIYLRSIFRILTTIIASTTTVFQEYTNRPDHCMTTLYRPLFNVVEYVSLLLCKAIDQEIVMPNVPNNVEGNATVVGSNAASSSSSSSGASFHSDINITSLFVEYCRYIRTFLDSQYLALVHSVLYHNEYIDLSKPNEIMHHTISTSCLGTVLTYMQYFMLWSSADTHQFIPVQTRNMLHHMWVACVNDLYTIHQALMSVQDYASSSSTASLSPLSIPSSSFPLARALDILHIPFQRFTEDCQNYSSVYTIKSEYLTRYMGHYVLRNRSYTEAIRGLGYIWQNSNENIVPNNSNRSVVNTLHHSMITAITNVCHSLQGLPFSMLPTFTASSSTVTPLDHPLLLPGILAIGRLTHELTTVLHPLQPQPDNGYISLSLNQLYSNPQYDTLLHSLTNYLEPTVVLSLAPVALCIHLLSQLISETKVSNDSVLYKLSMTVIHQLRQVFGNTTLENAAYTVQDTEIGGTIPTAASRSFGSSSSSRTSTVPFTFLGQSSVPLPDKLNQLSLLYGTDTWSHVHAHTHPSVQDLPVYYAALTGSIPAPPLSPENKTNNVSSSSSSPPSSSTSTVLTATELPFYTTPKQWRMDHRTAIETLGNDIGVSNPAHPLWFTLPSPSCLLGHTAAARLLLSTDKGTGRVLGATSISAFEAPNVPLYHPLLYSHVRILGLLFELMHTVSLTCSSVPLSYRSAQTENSLINYSLLPASTVQTSSHADFLPFYASFASLSPVSTAYLRTLATLQMVLHSQSSFEARSCLPARYRTEAVLWQPDPQSFRMLRNPRYPLHVYGNGPSNDTVPNLFTLMVDRTGCYDDSFCPIDYRGPYTHYPPLSVTSSLPSESQTLSFRYDETLHEYLWVHSSIGTRLRYLSLGLTSTYILRVLSTVLLPSLSLPQQTSVGQHIFPLTITFALMEARHRCAFALYLTRTNDEQIFRNPEILQSLQFTLTDDLLQDLPGVLSDCRISQGIDGAGAEVGATRLAWDAFRFHTETVINTLESNRNSGMNRPSRIAATRSSTNPPDGSGIITDDTEAPIRFPMVAVVSSNIRTILSRRLWSAPESFSSPSVSDVPFQTSSNYITQQAMDALNVLQFLRMVKWSCVRICIDARENRYRWQHALFALSDTLQEFGKVPDEALVQTATSAGITTYPGPSSNAAKYLDIVYRIEKHKQRQFPGNSSTTSIVSPASDTSPSQSSGVSNNTNVSLHAGWASLPEETSSMGAIFNAIAQTYSAFSHKDYLDAAVNKYESTDQFRKMALLDTEGPELSFQLTLEIDYTTLSNYIVQRWRTGGNFATTMEEKGNQPGYFSLPRDRQNFIAASTLLTAELACTAHHTMPTLLPGDIAWSGMIAQPITPDIIPDTGIRTKAMIELSTLTEIPYQNDPFSTDSVSSLLTITPQKLFLSLYTYPSPLSSMDPDGASGVIGRSGLAPSSYLSALASGSNNTEMSSSLLSSSSSSIQGMLSSSSPMVSTSDIPSSTDLSMIRRLALHRGDWASTYIFGNDAGMQDSYGQSEEEQQNWQTLDDIYRPSSDPDTLFYPADSVSMSYAALNIASIEALVASGTSRRNIVWAHPSNSTGRVSPSDTSDVSLLSFDQMYTIGVQLPLNLLRASLLPDSDNSLQTIDISNNEYILSTIVSPFVTCSVPFVKTIVTGLLQSSGTEDTKYLKYNHKDTWNRTTDSSTDNRLVTLLQRSTELIMLANQSYATASSIIGGISTSLALERARRLRIMGKLPHAVLALSSVTSLFEARRINQQQKLLSLSALTTRISAPPSSISLNVNPNSSASTIVSLPYPSLPPLMNTSHIAVAECTEEGEIYEEKGSIAWNMHDAEAALTLIHTACMHYTDALSIVIQTGIVLNTITGAAVRTPITKTLLDTYQAWTKLTSVTLVKRLVRCLTTAAHWLGQAGLDRNVTLATDTTGRTKGLTMDEDTMDGSNQDPFRYFTRTDTKDLVVFGGLVANVSLHILHTPLALCSGFTDTGTNKFGARRSTVIRTGRTNSLGTAKSGNNNNIVLDPVTPRNQPSIPTSITSSSSGNTGGGGDNISVNISVFTSMDTGTNVHGNDTSHQRVNFIALNPSNNVPLPIPSVSSSINAVIILTKAVMEEIRGDVPISLGLLSSLTVSKGNVPLRSTTASQSARLHLLAAYALTTLLPEGSLLASLPSAGNSSSNPSVFGETYRKEWDQCLVTSSSTWLSSITASLASNAHLSLARYADNCYISLLNIRNSPQGQDIIRQRQSKEITVQDLTVRIGEYETYVKEGDQARAMVSLHGGDYYAMRRYRDELRIGLEEDTRTERNTLHALELHRNSAIRHYCAFLRSLPHIHSPRIVTPTVPSSSLTPTNVVPVTTEGWMGSSIIDIPTHTAQVQTVFRLLSLWYALQHSEEVSHIIGKELSTVPPHLLLVALPQFASRLGADPGNDCTLPVLLSRPSAMIAVTPGTTTTTTGSRSGKGAPKQSTPNVSTSSTPNRQTTAANDIQDAVQDLAIWANNRTQWTFGGALEYLLLRMLIVAPHRTALQLLALEKGNRILTRRTKPMEENAAAVAKITAARRILYHGMTMAPRLRYAITNLRLLTDIYVSIAMRPINSKEDRNKRFYFNTVPLLRGIGNINLSSSGTIPTAGNSGGSNRSILSTYATDDPWDARFEGITLDQFQKRTSVLSPISSQVLSFSSANTTPLVTRWITNDANDSATDIFMDTPIITDAYIHSPAAVVDSFGTFTTSSSVSSSSTDPYALPVHIQSLGEYYTHPSSGISLPKILTVKGSNGRSYRQLIKGGWHDAKAAVDDLRQDATMQSVFSVINTLLRADGGAAVRNLRMRTYRVIPLAPTSGVIEWVEGVQPMGGYIDDSPWKAHSRHHPNEWDRLYCRSKMEQASSEWKKIAQQQNQERRTSTALLPTTTTTPLGLPMTGTGRGVGGGGGAGIMGSTPRSTTTNNSAVQDPRPKALAEIFAKRTPVFHHFFTETYPNPYEWAMRRLIYTRSTAVASALCYIAGISDRHYNNILLHCGSGEVLHIDFGLAFEQGRLLPTPEVLPFRLTREVITPMGITGAKGAFISATEHCVRVLRDGSDLVMAVLSVILHDPLYRWAMTPSKARALTTARNDNTSNLNPLSSMNNFEMTITHASTQGTNLPTPLGNVGTVSQSGFGGGGSGGGGPRRPLPSENEKSEGKDRSRSRSASVNRAKHDNNNNNDDGEDEDDNRPIEGMDENIITNNNAVGNRTTINTTGRKANPSRSGTTASVIDTHPSHNNNTAIMSENTSNNNPGVGNNISSEQALDVAALRVLRRVEAKLQGTDFVTGSNGTATQNGTITVGTEALPVSSQVIRMIEAAQDFQSLSRMYSGWTPWA